MESIIDMKNTTTLFDIARSWLQKHYFSPQSSPLPAHFFATNEQKPTCYAHQNLHGCLECGLSFTSLSPLLKCTTHHLTVLTSTAWSQKCSADVNELMQFFLHRGVQFQTFVSYALLCQTPFCQSAPLMLSVIQQ